MLVLALLAPPGLPAQARQVELRLGGQAVLAYTRVDPIPGGGDLGEVRIVQPVVMGRLAALRGHLLLQGSASLEGWTMPGGELTLGAWGEGFVDRRHPHTYVHELLLVGRDLLGRRDGAVDLSLMAGKGFAPFGTDDPMNRPALGYPVNHHLSQILERALVGAAVGWGPVLLEGAVFNGDEPERPGQWPNVRSRFADSWSVRGTLLPVAGLELQVSHADVASPEHRPGDGPEHAKWSASARWEGPVARLPAYGLVEWARTAEAGGFFVFRSFLAEGALRAGAHRPYYRFERTERPEELRTADFFRVPRPHHENSILGVTRWTVHTLGYRLDLRPGSESRALAALVVAPFVEVAHATAEREGQGIFDPEAFYGDRNFWAASIGIRIGWGMEGHRMGRYGAAETAGRREPAHQH